MLLAQLLNETGNVARAVQARAQEVQQIPRFGVGQLLLEESPREGP